MTPQEEAPTSSSMEEVAAKRPEEVRALEVKKEPHAASLSVTARTPPQSALRADSSSIEEERGAKTWLRRRAKEMRSEMTPHERAMWRLLHDGELISLNWRKQATLGGYIADFVSHPARLVVEMDGAQHAEEDNAKHDATRDAWLVSQGYRVLRFWNADVLNASDGVWREIHDAATATKAKSRMDRWRADHMAQATQKNAQLASSSMEEAPRSGGGGVRSVLRDGPQEASSSSSARTPPQSALPPSPSGLRRTSRADSSSVEEEQS